MKKPLVSICIPTYNRLDLLKENLQSCLDQTYANIEIIVTDNSTDNETEQYFRLLDNKKIKYFRNPKGTGPFTNLNIAISKATGKYIKFSFDDDLLKPTCIEKMTAILEKYQNVGVVMAPLDIINNEGDRIYPRFYIVKKMLHLYKYLDNDAVVPKKSILKDFLTRVYPCCVPTGIMFRKAVFNDVGDFDEDALFATDVEMCMRISTKYDFYYINEILSSWRFTDFSETVNFSQHGFNPNVFYYITKKYVKQAKNLGFSQKEIPALRKASYFFASKRLMLNVITGLKTRNVSLIIQTVSHVWHNDPYKTHLFLLPFSLLKELIVTFNNELSGKEV